MNTKRPWTRLEKSLFLFPPAIGAIAVGIWWWQLGLPQRPLELVGAERIRAVEWAPDSRRLVVCATFPLGANGLQSRAFVFDSQTRWKECELQLPPVAPPNYVWFNWPSWSPDGSRVAIDYTYGAFGPTETVHHGVRQLRELSRAGVWDARNGGLKVTFPYGMLSEDTLPKVAFSRDGQQIVGQGRPPALFDTLSGARLTRFGSPLAEGGRFNLAGKMVAVAGDGWKSLEVRDVVSRKMLWNPSVTHVGPLEWNRNDVLCVRDGERPHGMKKYHLIAWDGRAGRNLSSPPFHSVWAFVLAPTAPLLAVVDFPAINPTRYCQLVVWDLKANRAIWSRSFNLSLSSPMWSPDGQFLYVIEDDDGPAHVTIFDVHGIVRATRDFTTSLQARWAPDSKKIAVFYDNQIEVMTVDK